MLLVIVFKDSFLLPQGLTSSTEFKTAAGKKATLAGKVAGKWSHGKSGFCLDKLEIKPDGAMAIETSLTGVAPGLKLEFKGDDSFKGDLSVIYKNAVVTATADLDLLEFSKLKSAVVARTGPYTAGASTSVDIGGKNKIEFKSADVSLGYIIPKRLFAVVKTAKWFSEFNFSFAYEARSDITLSTLYTFNPKNSSASSLIVAGLYKCNPSTALKLKVDSKAVVGASIKQALDKYATATIGAEVDLAKVSAYKLGVTTTIG